MNVISVEQLCGRICINPIKGKALKLEISEELDSKHGAVCIDFSGVHTLTSSFLNVAIGTLYEEYSEKELAQRLRFRGLDKVDASLVQLVQDNAIRFFSAKPLHRTRLARVRPNLQPA